MQNAEVQHTEGVQVRGYSVERVCADAGVQHGGGVQMLGYSMEGCVNAGVS